VRVTVIVKASPDGEAGTPPGTALLPATGQYPPARG
jgi:hypothetical protein